MMPLSKPKETDAMLPAGHFDRPRSLWEEAVLLYLFPWRPILPRLCGEKQFQV